MTQENVDKWTKLANKLEESEVRLSAGPVPIVLAEANQVAQFVEQYWEPSEGRLGLEATAELVPKSVATDIASLVQACHYLHARSMFTNDDGLDRTIERGRDVADNLADALELVLDDGQSTANEGAFAVAKERVASSSSVAQLAQSLVDLAIIAEHETATLAKIKGFDRGIVDEAKKLAAEITAKPVTPGPAPSASVRLRDRMLTLLARKVSEVRKAARFVFRHHPEILKLATSSYQRRRRAANRKQSGAGQTADEVTAPTSAPIG